MSNRNNHVIAAYFLLIVILTYFSFYFNFEIGNQYVKDFIKQQAKELSNKQAFKNKSIEKIKHNSMRDYETDSLLEVIWSQYKKTGTNPDIAVATIKVESRGNKHAMGLLHDSGLYQFLPETARYMCVKTGMKYYRGIEFNPAKATKLWFAYFSYLQKQFNNTSLTLLAYNCGEGNVRKYGFNVKNTIYKNSVSYDTKILMNI
jgi:soluble lytic murein transglycosylase-like protein